MATVIERFGTDTSTGLIVHDDRPSTFEHAENIAGRRLDRRRSYAIVQGKVCGVARWTADCSGCRAYSGECLGCNECGYTGKVRQAMWVPIDVLDAELD